MNDLLFLFPVAIGAFSAGTILGAIVLRPRVGPWRSQRHGRPVSDPRRVNMTPTALPVTQGWVLVDPRQGSLPAAPSVVAEPSPNVIYVLPGEYPHTLQALLPVSGEERHP